MLHAMWKHEEAVACYMQCGKGSWQLSIIWQKWNESFTTESLVLFSYVKMYFEFQLLLLVFLLFRYFVVAWLI
jgi:hypothetical protein